MSGADCALRLARQHQARGWWYHEPRLTFQPVLIWWKLCAGVIDWP
jgi:hypothetical protein